MNDITLFDIETGPLPIEKLRAVMPKFSAPSNWKDEAKIEANVKEQEEKWMSNAALSPMTGQVVSIAYQTAGDPSSFESFGIADTDEASLLKAFLVLYRTRSGGAYGKLAGWNIKGFDLSFIVRRCWALGIKVPGSLMAKGTVRFYWPTCFIDLREIWGCGEYQVSGSLDAVGIAFGLGFKKGHGADFARLYVNPETRDKAIEYQRSEMRICDGLCQRFGLTGSEEE